MRKGAMNQIVLEASMVSRNLKCKYLASPKCQIALKREPNLIKFIIAIKESPIYPIVSSYLINQDSYTLAEPATNHQEFGSATEILKLQAQTAAGR